MQVSTSIIVSSFSGRGCGKLTVDAGQLLFQDLANSR